jgi:hypothetical protein
MSAPVRSEGAAFAIGLAIKTVSLFGGLLVATLVFGMSVGSGFMLTFIIVAAALRLALGLAIERPSVIRGRYDHG